MLKTRVFFIGATDSCIQSVSNPLSSISLFFFYVRAKRNWFTKPPIGRDLITTLGGNALLHHGG